MVSDGGKSWLWGGDDGKLDENKCILFSRANYKHGKEKMEKGGGGLIF